MLGRKLWTVLSRFSSSCEKPLGSRRRNRVPSIGSRRLWSISTRMARICRCPHRRGMGTDSGNDETRTDGPADEDSPKLISNPTIWDNPPRITEAVLVGTDLANRQRRRIPSGLRHQCEFRTSGLAGLHPCVHRSCSLSATLRSNEPQRNSRRNLSQTNPTQRGQLLRRLP